MIARVTYRADTAGAKTIVAQLAGFQDPDPSNDAAQAVVTVVPPPPPPPPPPEVILSAVAPTVRYRLSDASGKLRVTGTSGRAARLELAVLDGARVLARRAVDVAAGAFDVPLAVPAALHPGVYLLRVRELGAPVSGALPERVLRFRVPAPPEGVADRAGVSGLAGGPFASVLAARRTIFARFHLAALPARGRAITTQWYRGGAAVEGRVGKSRAATLGAYLKVKTGTLPPGRYRCLLRTGRTVIAVASVRIRPA
jgi:hypothetical protein